MKLERLRDMQVDELMQWMGELDTILTPDNMNPSDIKQFPATIEASERLKRICKWRADELKNQIECIEDDVIDGLEAQETIYKHTAGGMPLTKKKYNTVEKLQRAKRLKLREHEEYNRLVQEEKEWRIMYSDWVSHKDRLRRDLRLLEEGYE